MVHAGSVEGQKEQKGRQGAISINQIIINHIKLIYRTVQRKVELLVFFNPNDHHILNIPGRYNNCSSQ